MAPFTNYKELKECLSALEVATALGLRLRAEKGQLRGQCPACGGKDGREISINTKLRSFYCHSAKQGGSLIDLAAHIMGCDFRDAAQHLQRMFGQCPTRHEPRKSEPPFRSEPAKVPERGGLDAVRNNLAWQHPDVQRLGLSPQSAMLSVSDFNPRVGRKAPYLSLCGEKQANSCAIGRYRLLPPRR